MGAGLVTLGIPRSLNQILEIKLTEVMTLPLDETPEKTLSLEAFGKIREFARKSTAVAVGPGMSTNNSTRELVKRLIAELEVPMILDADGISAFAGEVSLLRQRRAPLIITPHPGEMGQLLEVPTDRIQIDRLGAATALARDIGKVVVLKGARTIICDRKGETWINPTGNPGMASGGTGDVLTGIISGLLAQEIPPFTSARTGVYLHGLAGDIAATNSEELTLVALDVIKCFPEAIRRVRSEYS
jgi:NAD(P)H-hydrate epimerase